MVVLTTSTSPQSFKVIPRSAQSSVTFELTDKSKRKTSAVTVSVANSNGYMTVTGTYVDAQSKALLIEGRFYSFVIKNSSTIIYRGTIFCTDQTNFNTFNVNSGEYTTENTYDNDYIILWQKN